jgi:hypothetical protein
MSHAKQNWILRKICENFNFAKRPRGMQEQNCAFHEFVYICRQEFTSYAKNQIELKSSYNSLDSVLCCLEGFCYGNKPAASNEIDSHECWKGKD